MQPEEKQTPAEKTLSQFNAAVVSDLRKYMKNRKLAVEMKAKAVTLATDILKRPVIFAAFRSTGNRKSDIRFYGYMPSDTSLTKYLQTLMVDEGTNGWFFKGELDPDVAAQALFLHMTDVRDRVEKYAKVHKVKPGTKPKRTWSAVGIPLSYFKD